MMISEATRGDVPAVIAVVSEVLSEFGLRFGEGSTTDAQLQNLPDSYAGGAFWVAREGGEIVGTCGVFPVSEGAYELRKMYLRSSARGTGAGKQLLQTALAWARAHGGRQMVLDTVEEMTRAIVFYEANGFVRDDAQVRGSRCTRGYSLDLGVRVATEADAAACSAIYAPFVRDTAISFEMEPPDLLPRMRMAHVWLVCEVDGVVVGYAYGAQHRDRLAYQWSVDVSVYVQQGQHRRGVGRRLYRTLLSMLRARGFYAAHAGVTLPNESSVRLHESFGFKPVGVFEKVGFKQGAWHDVGWWQLELRPREGTPVPLKGS